MMVWLTTWWVWIAVALVLGIVEVLASGFIFLGFALGSLVLGILMLLMPWYFSGIGPNLLLAIFAVLALGGWLFLRFAFRRQSSGAETFTDDIND